MSLVVHEQRCTHCSRKCVTRELEVLPCSLIITYRNVTHTLVFLQDHATVFPCDVSKKARQPASQPANQPTNQLAIRPTNQPTNQSASKPVIQPTTSQSTKPKRDGTKQTKRNNGTSISTKQNKTKRNKTKRNETKRNKSKQKQVKRLFHLNLQTQICI